jgi:membrane fusion protein, multidrug efflux system
MIKRVKLLLLSQQGPLMNEKFKYFNHKISFWLILLGILIIIITYGFFHTHSAKKTNTPPPQHVVVTGVKTATVPVYLSALGSVVGSRVVTVRTQINGRLIRVAFTEGQMVKKGELLAEIDPSPYQSQLLQYQGQLERDQALLANAKIDLQRYQTLWTQDSVAKQVLDTQVSLVSQYEGVVKLDEGLIAGVKVNLGYCEITSPIDGRVGLRLVDPGNYVQTSDTTGIAVLTMINPIDVIFTIAEDAVPEVMQQMQAVKSIPVEAYDRAQNKLLATGKLLTIDNQIDPTTGTVKLKAEFANENNQLFPNQFVNVRLLVATLKNATVVPTLAIQTGVSGNYVYLLEKDSTVRVQPVVIGVTQGDITTIKLGLSPHQSVVTEGADKLTDGIKVIPEGLKS